MNYNFSEDIKSIREILGFSQKELAEKLGVEQVTVSRVIRWKKELERQYKIFRRIRDKKK